MEKHLFIKLTVQDGERQYSQYYLTRTDDKNIDFTAESIAARFWGECDFRDGDTWYHFNGEVATRIDSVKEITKEEFKLLNEFLYS